MTTPHANTERDYEAMDARREQLRVQVLETARKIVEVIKRDIEKFGERESRWRFLRHIDFAEGLTDDQIRSLKQRLKAFALEAGDEIDKRLGQDALWLANVDAPRAGATKSLEANEAVWGELQVVASQFARVLREFDFPPDPPQDIDHGVALEGRYHLVYRTPAYFLDGVYCPSLIESYWSQLGELNKLGDAIDSARSETRRKSLEERWNRV